MRDEIVARNAAGLARLRGLLAGLDEERLARSVGGGWTVAVVLAHAAFWDRRARFVLERLASGLPPNDLPEWYGPMLNEALTPEWLALPPRAAARLAVEAADDVGRAVENLPRSVLDGIVATGEIWRLNRALHRDEHIAQIEASLEG